MQSELEDEVVWDSEPDDDALKVFQQHRNKKYTKVSQQTAASFQAKKTTVYAAARKQSRETVTAVNGFLDQAIAQLIAMKAQEVAFEKYTEDYAMLDNTQEGSFKRLLMVYPDLLDEVGSRRSKQIDATVQTLDAIAHRRQAKLDSFSKRARSQVEEARQREKIASDASALIKHYKNLLYS